MIGIVHVVVIDRGETHQEDGPADERPRPLRIAEDLLGIERRPFDRKALFGFQPSPAEVARFGKGPISPAAEGKLRTPGRNRRSKNSANEPYSRDSNSLMSMWYLRTNGSICRALQRVLS